LKKIPYGIIDYKKLKEEDYLYVDKTPYIEKLENSEDTIIYLRPGRFGKSLFTSMMYYYYDINSKDIFDSLFKDTYIYSNQTPKKNSYYVLKFDFSGITTKGMNSEELKNNFRKCVISGINEFLSYYKLEYEIKPIIGRYVKEHEIVYNTIYNVFKDFSSKNVNIVGKNNILKQPEFNNIDKVKNIFTKLDEEDIMKKIDYIEDIEDIEENNKNIKVYIGKESNIDDDMTIVKTKYHTSKEEGTIAIVGPKRMDYDRVVSLLEYIKSNLEN